VIKLSNGHSFEYVVASGAFGFDGKGWFWERLLIWLGFIKPKLFVIVLKTLTAEPRKGNLDWRKPWTWLPFSPWSCVRLLPGRSVVNKVGLTNKGFAHWLKHIAPTIDFENQRIVVSLLGTKAELVMMTRQLEQFNLVAIEINDSCPNDLHPHDKAESAIEAVKAVKKATRHPVWIKLGVEQEYLYVAHHLKGVAEAASLNSVPWSTVYRDLKSPVEHVGAAGKGGVSGGAAQRDNWVAAGRLAEQNALPVICPSVMSYEDMRGVRSLGVDAVSFGAIHLPTRWKPWTLLTNPCKPTWFVFREAAERSRLNPVVT